MVVLMGFDGSVYLFLPDPVTGNWDPRLPTQLEMWLKAPEDMGSDFWLNRSEPEVS
ncbi:MAG: hypothetical protein Ct9H300mP15_11950 [Gemmatimonadota bacterium]|nr:MAG: hypothetical protein Ct9H300mP15_11950 [Gemmatimonadota bacterium]